MFRKRFELNYRNRIKAQHKRWQTLYEEYFYIIGRIRMIFYVSAAVSILLSANRFIECWKTFRYFLGKDHGKVSIRERGTETSFRRYLFSRIFANSAIPLSVPTVCRVHFLQLPRLSRFFSASTFLTARPLVSVRRRSRNYLRDMPLKDRRHLSHW